MDFSTMNGEDFYQAYLKNATRQQLEGMLLYFLGYAPQGMAEALNMEKMTRA